MITRFGHTLHLTFKGHYVVAYIVTAIGAVGIGLSAFGGPPEMAITFVAGYLELFGSIAFAMMLAHVFTVDRDDGGAEVLATYPVARPVLALERLLAGTVWSGAPFVLAAGIMHWYVAKVGDPILLDSIRMGPLLGDAALSWLFLSGITLVGSTLADSWLAGLFAGGLYWIIDFLTGGSITGNVFLFARTLPLPILSIDSNRRLLFVVGAALYVLAVARFSRRRTRW